MLGVGLKAKEVEFGSIRHLIFKIFSQPSIDSKTSKLNTVFTENNKVIEFQKVYDGVSVKSDLYQMARIYALIHPNPRELSIRTPGGKLR